MAITPIVAASLITSAAGIGSSAVSGGRSRKSQRRAQKYTRENMQTQMRYNTQMSNTAHQRGVADMRAAGLNPLMMYGGGQSSASAPTSSAPGGATGVSADSSGIERGVSSAVQTIMESKRIKALERQTQSNIDLNKEKQKTEKSQQTKNYSSTPMGKYNQNIEAGKAIIENNKKAVKTGFQKVRKATKPRSVYHYDNKTKKWKKTK